LDPEQCDVISEIKKLTGGGADVAIEALGLQATFENAPRCLRPGGTLSSLGVYSGKLQVPYDAFAAGLGDHRIVTTLCPGGKERMRRLLELVRHRRIDLVPMLTHSFPLDRIADAYALFGGRPARVAEVADGTHDLVRQASELAGGARDKLRAWFPGWEVGAEVRVGSPARQLLDAADALKPDLLVVGAHGRTGLSRFFMGSVSQKAVTE